MLRTVVKIAKAVCEYKIENGPIYSNQYLVLYNFQPDADMLDRRQNCSLFNEE